MVINLKLYMDNIYYPYNNKFTFKKLLVCYTISVTPFL